MNNLLDFFYIINMNITKEDIETIKEYIANVFPKLESHKSKGFGTGYPFNMSHITWELDLPELEDSWELIRIYEDNSVCLDRTLYHGKKFNCAKSWSEVPFYKNHEDIQIILDSITQLSKDYKRFQLEYKLKEIKHDFR